MTKTMIILISSMAFLFLGCGKDVTYGTDALNPPETGVTINCLTECEELGGDVRNAPIEIVVGLRGRSHNQTLCADFKVHGSSPYLDLGCNDAPAAPHTVLTKLRDEGDRQRVTMRVEAANPGNFNVNHHPGHFSLCTEESPLVWINGDDLVGIEDFNDITADIISVDGHTLSLEYEDDKVYLVLVERN